MQVIAHRCNFKDTIEVACRHGVDLVEADLRVCRDKVVLNHDAVPARLTGNILDLLKPISRLPFRQLDAILSRAGLSLLSLEKLAEDSSFNSPMVFDIKGVAAVSEPMIDALQHYRKPHMVAVRSLSALQSLVERGVEDPKSIVMFLYPGLQWQLKRCVEMGVGAVRLWEAKVTPQAVDQLHNMGVKVWVTMGSILKTGDSSEARLRKVAICGADAVLLDDVEEGVRVIRGNELR
jgi:glycerophosphoryl diester phosphodiesterase